MGKVQFELNLRGLNELMMSAEMQSHLDACGASVAAAARDMQGKNYGHRTHVADYVAITNVFPADYRAGIDNNTHNTLEKALGVAGLPRTKG